MGSFTGYDTQRLTRARLELVAGRGRWRGWLPAMLVVVLVIAGAVAIVGPGPLDGVTLTLPSLSSESGRLQSELQRTRLELDMERATRTELERRNQALAEQVTALNQQLDFVNSRTNRQTTTLPPPRPADNPEE